MRRDWSPDLGPRDWWSMPAVRWNCAVAPKPIRWMRASGYRFLCTRPCRKYCRADFALNWTVRQAPSGAKSWPQCTGKIINPSGDFGGGRPTATTMGNQRSLGKAAPLLYRIEPGRAAVLRHPDFICESISTFSRLHRVLSIWRRLRCRARRFSPCHPRTESCRLCRCKMSSDWRPFARH